MPTITLCNQNSIEKSEMNKIMENAGPEAQQVLYDSVKDMTSKEPIPEDK